MINLGRFKLPPLKNALDVAMQTVRQQMPDKSGPPPPRPPQNVRFANLGMYNTYLMSLLMTGVSPGTV